MLPRLIIAFFCILTAGSVVGAQQRIAVLPFRNMDRDIKYNTWTIEMADSLFSAISAVDPEQKQFVLVPADSIEMALAELNLNPSNPQYESDMWKAVRMLNVTKAVQGNFQLRGERVLINCYVYDIASMLADQVNQAKDLYKTPTNYLDSIHPIVKRIYPGLTQ